MRRLATAFNTTISGLTTAEKQSLAAVGLTQFLPYSNFPQTQTVRQSLVPFPQYTGASDSRGRSPREKLVRRAPDQVHEALQPRLDRECELHLLEDRGSDRHRRSVQPEFGQEPQCL